MAGTANAPNREDTSGFNIDDLFQHMGGDTGDRADVVRPPEPDEQDEDYDDDEEEAIDGEVVDVGEGEEIPEEAPKKKEPVEVPQRENTQDTYGSSDPRPYKPPAPGRPTEPGTLGDENTPPEEPMQETNSTTSRPSRLSRLSSKLSSASNISSKLKGMLKNSLSRSSSNMQPRLTGKDRVVRKYQFSTNGVMHYIDVSHSQEVFYLILDNKVIAKKHHSNQTFSSETYTLDFLVPSGSSDRNVALPGKLTVKWRVAAGKWRYEMFVGGKTVPCMWKHGKETGKEVLALRGDEVQTKAVPDGAEALRPEQSPSNDATPPAQEVNASDERPTEEDERRANDLALLSNNKAQPARREHAARETDQKEAKTISMSAPDKAADNDRAKQDLALLNRFAPQPRAQQLSM